MDALRAEVFELLALLVDQEEDLEPFQPTEYEFATPLAAKLGPHYVVSMVMEFLSTAKVLQGARGGGGGGGAGGVHLWCLQADLSLSPALNPDGNGQITWLLPHYLVQTILADLASHGLAPEWAVVLQAQLEQQTHARGLAFLQTRLATNPANCRSWAAYACMLVHLARQAEAEDVLVKILSTPQMVSSETDAIHLCLLLCLCSLVTGHRASALLMTKRTILKTSVLPEGPSALLRFRKVGFRIYCPTDPVITGH